MNILFLDIDGVLAPLSRSNPDVWCAETCARLKRFIDATDAKVVLVSSWPLDESRERLAEHGIELNDAIGERDRRGYMGRYGLLAREAGIVDYLESHNVSAWVWLDDFGMLRDAEEVSYNNDGTRKMVRSANPLLRGYVETIWFCDDGEAHGAGFDDAAYERAIATMGRACQGKRRDATAHE